MKINTITDERDSLLVALEMLMFNFEIMDRNAFKISYEEAKKLTESIRKKYGE